MDDVEKETKSTTKLYQQEWYRNRRKALASTDKQEWEENEKR